MNLARHPKRGVALALTLGFIALLTLLIAALMDVLRVRLVEGELRAQRITLRSDAESALEVLRGRLAVFESDAAGFRLNSADLERIAADPLAGWVPTDGATVSVKVRDMSALVSLNSTDTVSLSKFFEDLNISTDRAAALADCLADWTDADDNARINGAESDAYGEPGKPANRPLRSFADLRRVKGFDEMFFEADGSLNAAGRELAAGSTFIYGGAKPNLNTASETMLRLLATHTGTDPATIMAFRTPLDYPNDRTHRGVLKNAGDLVQIGSPEGLANRVSFASERIRVTVTAAKGDLRYVLDAILAPPSLAGGSTPVAVIARMDEGLLSEDADEGAALGDSAAVEEPGT